MKKQKVMSQMKGQDKTPQKQLNAVETGNFPEKKKIQNNDSKDDPGSWKNNGETQAGLDSMIHSAQHHDRNRRHNFCSEFRLKEFMV